MFAKGLFAFHNNFSNLYGSTSRLLDIQFLLYTLKIDFFVELSLTILNTGLFILLNKNLFIRHYKNKYTTYKSLYTGCQRIHETRHNF